MQTEWTIQNPQASMPLRVPLAVDCNTPEEKILANVLVNSRRAKRWVKQLPAHDGLAVICGGGPSLADSVSRIESLHADGGKVFALNAAAWFLAGKGILPDFQVIMDAQPQTATLIGPAKDHLFASQVDPECFDRIPNATLWHATYGDVMVDQQEGFPKHYDDYCLVGGAVTVGNTSLALLYALGYRRFEIFGMDSSHREGNSHAYRQAMNDGDPCTLVDFGGKRYLCSITMRLQSENFLTRARQLQAMGCEIAVHGEGLLPAMFNEPHLSEDEKYRRMWALPVYRDTSPGELSGHKFLDLVKPDGSVIDFGCGTGRGALAIHAAGHDVTLVDFAVNCRDPGAMDLPFVQADLTQPIPVAAPYGYCVDVLEHIPPENVEAVIVNIMQSCPTLFFQISTVPDSMGALIGQPLHLTVREHDWWLRLFGKLGYAVTRHEAGAIASTFIVKNH